MVEFSDIKNTLQLHGVSDEKLIEVEDAYYIAEELHKGQKRKSGEPYIIHPLHVAKNIFDMELYDPDMISAALLHDTIEDARRDFTEKDIAQIINPDVASLVEGVTRMRRMDFISDNDEFNANTLKILEGFNKDLRIIVLKLADRLHNMRTLEYMEEEKQTKKSIETKVIYVPVTYTIGAYQIKSELEDLSLKYIEPDIFQRIVEEKAQLYEQEKPYLEETRAKIKQSLLEMGISSDIIIRSKNITTIYDKLNKGYKLENIYDLFYLKILVPGVDECYLALGNIHRMFPAINGRFKDYISNHRINFYQSLHTTVSDNRGELLKVKIRTHDMDKVAAFGIPALWSLGIQTREETQREIVENLPLVKTLIELEKDHKSNLEVVETMTTEILTEHIDVFTHSGEIIELPAGSTALDFACQFAPDLLDKMTGILVNGKEVPLNRALKNNDRLQILTHGKINHDNWEEYVSNDTSKQKIKKINEIQKKSEN